MRNLLTIFFLLISPSFFVRGEIYSGKTEGRASKPARMPDKDKSESYIKDCGWRINTDGSFSVKGRIRHFGNGFLVGTIVNTEYNTVTLDTVWVKNDIFNHRCSISDKQVVRYVAGKDRFSRYRKVAKDGDSVWVDFADKRLKAIEVVAYPGAKIKISGMASSYLDAYPSSDAENRMIAALNRQRYPLLDEWSDLDFNDKKNIRKILQRDRALTDSVSYIEHVFISNNPSSIISSYLVLQEFQGLNKRDPVRADSLLTTLTPHADDIYYQNMLLLQRNRSKQTSLSVGDIFPDFQTRTVYKDSVFSLSQTKGKYRLIDFWGTWCIPCVREMPKLKQFYEKHKDKLILIGIANIDTYQNWKAFLDKNTYTWTQLIDLGPDKLSDRIKIEVYPTKYLLDPDGTIILIVKDADEAVWNKIEALIE